MTDGIDADFVRRLAEQADQLAEDRLERNARIRELEAELEVALRERDEWKRRHEKVVLQRDVFQKAGGLREAEVAELKRRLEREQRASDAESEELSRQLAALKRRLEEKGEEDESAFDPEAYELDRDAEREREKQLEAEDGGE